MLSAWGNAPYAELSVVLVFLRHLSIVHQTNHWQAKGDSFYGDHKLFEEMYQHVLGEIDSVAERAVGLGQESNVDPLTQMRQVLNVELALTQATIPSSNMLVNRSLGCEQSFITNVSTLMSSMRDSGTLTLGVENFLSQVIDDHERHVYLLKRRNGAR